MSTVENGTSVAIDLDKTTVTLEPEKPSAGGLHLAVNDRIVYRPKEGKSRLGLDVLAIAKRESKGDGVFKVPKDRSVSTMTSIEEEEKSTSSGLDEVETDLSHAGRSHSGRRYRGTGVQDSPRSEKALSRNTHVSDEHPRSEKKPCRETPMFQMNIHVLRFSLNLLEILDMLGPEVQIDMIGMIGLEEMTEMIVIIRGGTQGMTPGTITGGLDKEIVMVK